MFKELQSVLKCLLLVAKLLPCSKCPSVRPLDTNRGISRLLYKIDG